MEAALAVLGNCNLVIYYTTTAQADFGGPVIQHWQPVIYCSTGLNESPEQIGSFLIASNIACSISSLNPAR